MKIGVNFFGAKSFIKPKFKETLDELSKMACEHVEPIIYFEKDKKMYEVIPGFTDEVMSDKEVMEKLEELKNRKLPIINCHLFVPYGQTIDQKVEQIICFSKESGIKTFVVSTMFATKEDCEKQAKCFTKAAKLLAKQGIQLDYHNHESEFTKIMMDGKQTNLMEYFLSLVSVEVKMQVDVGWVLFGGDDEVEFTRNHIAQIDSIHLKDFKKGYTIENRENDNVAIGEGCLKLEEIIKIIKENEETIHSVVLDQDLSNEDIISDWKTGLKNVKKLSER